MPCTKRGSSSVTFCNVSVWYNKVRSSDEPEPSWLEPQLELKDFQLGSARDLFHFSSELKID